MAFEYDDGNVEVVILGGTNKKTGKSNPTDLTGYYLRKDSIETKFGNKPFYIFKTREGDKGVIGSGNLNKIMESKVVGLLTHVVDTGTTKDVGKGNPMKVFKVGQDAGDSIGLAQPPQQESAASSRGYDSEESDDSDLFGEGDGVGLDEVLAPAASRAPAPAVASRAVTALSNQDRIKALMSRGKNTATR